MCLPSVTSASPLTPSLSILAEDRDKHGDTQGSQRDHRRSQFAKYLIFHEEFRKGCTEWDQSPQRNIDRCDFRAQ